MCVGLSEYVWVCLSQPNQFGACARILDPNQDHLVRSRAPYRLTNRAPDILRMWACLNVCGRVGMYVGVSELLWVCLNVYGCVSMCVGVSECM